MVVWDVDWSTVSMRTEDPARMARVLAGWDSHLTHTTLPRTLGLASCERPGSTRVRMEGHTFATDELSRRRTAAGSWTSSSSSWSSQRLVDAEDAKAWGHEQRALAERGAFYFACIQFCFAAARPR